IFLPRAPGIADDKGRHDGHHREEPVHDRIPILLAGEVPAEKRAQALAAARPAQRRSCLGGVGRPPPRPAGAAGAAPRRLLVALAPAWAFATAALSRARPVRSTRAP